MTLSNHSDKSILRFNGMYTEVRKDFLRGLQFGSTEEYYSVMEALEFAGGKGMYVNLDKIIEQVRASCGRKVARELQDALTGDLEQLPILALTGSPLTKKIATDRLERACGYMTPQSLSRSTLIKDDARVIVSTRAQRLKH